MHREKLKHIQDCIGREETTAFLKIVLKEGKKLLVRLNRSFENGQYHEVLQQLAQSIGSIYLYSSQTLTELCKQALIIPISEYSKADIDAFKVNLNREFKKTFSGIEEFLSCRKISPELHYSS